MSRVFGWSQRLPLGEVLAQSGKVFLSVLRKAPTLLRLGWTWALVASLGSWGVSEFFAMFAGDATYGAIAVGIQRHGWIVVAAPCLAIVAMATCRLLENGDPQPGRWFGAGVDRAEKRTIAIIVFLAILNALYGWAVLQNFPANGTRLEPSQFGRHAILVLTAILVMWSALRLSVFMPLAARDERVGLVTAWRTLSGRYWWYVQIFFTPLVLVSLLWWLNWAPAFDPAFDGFRLPMPDFLPAGIWWLVWARLVDAANFLMLATVMGASASAGLKYVTDRAAAAATPAAQAQ